MCRSARVAPRPEDCRVQGRSPSLLLPRSRWTEARPARRAAAQREIAWCADGSLISRSPLTLLLLTSAHRELAALIGEKRPIDLFGAQLDIVARHSAFLEVLLPSVGGTRDGSNFFNCFVPC